MKHGLRKMILHKSSELAVQWPFGHLERLCSWFKSRNIICSDIRNPGALDFRKL